MNGSESDWAKVTSGVPQGSVLGPLLFLVYINDIDENINSNLAKFADDTKIGGKIKNSKDHKRIQDDLDKLSAWANNWYMSFNVNKCKVMHIGTNNPKNKYRMDGIELEVVSEEKDLGVLISSNMKPSQHCTQIADKANKILGLIKRSIVYKNEQTILKLYKSLVRPHLEYAQQFWSPTQKNDMKKLEIVQKRATKIIPGLNSMEYEARLKKLDLYSLEYRRKRGDLIETYKIVRQNSALKFDDHFRYDQNGLRLNGLKILPTIGSRGGPRHSFFFNRATRSWNDLKTPSVSAPTINSFKREIDRDHGIRCFKSTVWPSS